MRIAVLADIHGNIHAFEAVLEHLQKQAIDQIIIAGDFSNGLCHPVECINLAKSLDYPLLRGNHERYLFDLDTPKADPFWYTEAFAGLRWAKNKLSEEIIQEFRALSMHHHLDNLLITHASYRDDYDSILDKTTDDELRNMFNGSDETFIIRGHNHRWLEKHWDRRHLISIGSLGLPLNGSQQAQYLIAEQVNHQWHFYPQYVDYDIEATIKSFATTGYIQVSPISRLFLQELITSEWQLIPFWTKFGDAYDKGELTLEQAVNKYLNQ